MWIFELHEDEIRCECIQYIVSMQMYMYYVCWHSDSESEEEVAARQQLHQLLHQHHLLGGEEAEAEAETEAGESEEKREKPGERKRE